MHDTNLQSDISKPELICDLLNLTVFKDNKDLNILVNKEFKYCSLISDNTNFFDNMKSVIKKYIIRKTFNNNSFNNRLSDIDLNKANSIKQVSPIKKTSTNDYKHFTFNNNRNIYSLINCADNNADFLNKIYKSKNQKCFQQAVSLCNQKSDFIEGSDNYFEINIYPNYNISVLIKHGFVVMSIFELYSDIQINKLFLSFIVSSLINLNLSNNFYIDLKNNKKATDMYITDNLEFICEEDELSNILPLDIIKLKLYEIVWCKEIISKFYLCLNNIYLINRDIISDILFVDFYVINFSCNYYYTDNYNNFTSKYKNILYRMNDINNYYNIKKNYLFNKELFNEILYQGELLKNQYIQENGKNYLRIEDYNLDKKNQVNILNYVKYFFILI